MLKKITLALSMIVFLILSPVPTSALPVIDLGVGPRYWAATPSGDLSYKGGDLNLEDTLGLDREWSPSAYIRARLPFIILDAHFTQLDYSGDLKNFSTNNNLVSFKSVGTLFFRGRRLECLIEILITGTA